MIKNDSLQAGFGLAQNTILRAWTVADYAGQSLRFWDNAEIFKDKKALKKRPRVEALLDEIRGQYTEYFPVNIPMLDAHKAIQEITAAVLTAADIYATGKGYYIGYGPHELPPLRRGINYCGEMETAILNASISYACYKIGDAVYMAANGENVALIVDGKPVPDAEHVEADTIRADALAALEPVREKYGLIFPIARNIEEADALTDKYDISGFSFVLEKIWKTSGVDII